MSMKEILTSLGVEERNLGGFGGEWMGSGPELEVTTPIDGSRLATVQQVTEEEYDAVCERYSEWRVELADRSRALHGPLPSPPQASIPESAERGPSSASQAVPHDSSSAATEGGRE